MLFSPEKEGMEPMAITPQGPQDRMEREHTTERSHPWAGCAFFSMLLCKAKTLTQKSPRWPCRDRASLGACCDCSPFTSAFMRDPCSKLVTCDGGRCTSQLIGLVCAALNGGCPEPTSPRAPPRGPSGP